MKALVIKIYQISLLLLVFWGGHAWFTWSWDFFDNKQKFVLYFLFSLIAVFYAVIIRVRIRFDVRLLLCISSYILAGFVNASTLNSFFFLLFSLIPLIVLISDNKHCILHLEFITKSMVFILVPGIILYVFIILGYQLPGIPMQYGDLTENFSYLFLNHIFLLTNVYWDEAARFSSVFLEPGYIGSLLAFLLYANRYNFKKKYNVVLLVALLVTFSLAGYIISLVGYFLTKKHLIRVAIKYSIPMLLLIVGIVVFAVNYNKGDNIVNVMLVDRLMPSDDGKGIKGNTRASEQMDAQLENTIQRGELLFGSRNLRDDEVENAGYKRYLVTNGLVPALLWLSFYALICSYCKDKRYGIVFVFLIFLTFLQAAYPGSYSWIIPVILGIKSYN